MAQDYFLPFAEKFKEFFPVLKSACALVMIDPAQNNLDFLSSSCDNASPEILGKMMGYILVPLGVQLSKRDDDKSCSILKCLAQILQRSSIFDIDTFLNVFSLTIIQLQDTNSPEIVRQTSEELKLEVVKCISQLMKSSTSEVRETFLTRKYYSKLSVGIFLFSQLATFEKYLTLRIAALNCLMLLTNVSDDIPCADSFKPHLADVLMLMLPGLSSKCLAIINNDETQNHKPVVLALRLWSRVVSVVMTNYSSEENPLLFSLQRPSPDELNTNSMRSLRLSNLEDFPSAVNRIKRDKDWLASTDAKLSSVTRLIVACQTHQHWRVRLELASLSFHLLNTAGVNMPQSVGYLTEALTFLSQDNNGKVSSASQAYIRKLGEKFEADQRLVGIVEENLFALLTRLPRLLHATDISGKEKELILLCGYVDILGKKHLPAVLSSAHHLRRFLHSLIVTATPISSTVSLIHEPALRGLNASSFSPEAKWRHLRFCDSQKCEDALKSLCQKLVRYSDVEMLVNSLLDEFNSDVHVRKNILLLFIHLFSSGSSGDLQTFSSLIKDVLAAIMDPMLWSVSTVLEDAATPRNIIQENIVQVCLLTELVGCLSSAAGRDMFSPLLLHCLYPVLESAASPLPIISSAGELSLKKLSELYENGDVGTLIRNNVDYLSHHVMVKLRQAHRNPCVLSVLSIIMEHSSLNLLPSLHEIINDVLIQSCDMFQDINGSAFLQVFHTYLSCIRKWTLKPPPEAPQKQQRKGVESLISELVDFQDTLRAADVAEPIESFADPRQFSMDNAEEEKAEEEAKVQLPDHIKLTKDILSRTLHFLPVNNIPRQILVLEILNHGVAVLSSWKEELLPLVHKIWSPLVDRFKLSNHPLLLQRAFSLLLTLARYSRDFIRVRTSKEVLPLLCKVLAESSEESRKRDQTGAYLLSQLYKLQLLLLSGLGSLAQDLELGHKQAYSILEAATPYLNANQPPSLKELCIELYMEIADSHPDIVWAHLMTISPRRLELKPPCEGLENYQVDESGYNPLEYSAAVDRLLSVI